MLLNTREALAQEAQRELSLEFSCVDQEYRYAVTCLRQFVEQHGSATGDDEPMLDNGAT